MSIIPFPRPPIKTIAGSGGGGKRGGGSQASGGGTEAPNTLSSSQLARIIDLLGEGPIVGPFRGLQSVFFDGVQVVSDGGVANFSNWSIAGYSGWPAQPVLPGFAAQQAETSVGLQVKAALPLTRTVNNGNVNRVRLTVSVPALQQADANNNVTGTAVAFAVYIQANGGGYALVAQPTISGKTNTRYQRSYSITLPWDPPWDIRLVRLTPDSTTTNMQNDLYWDSYTEIIDTQINYTLSAVIGVTIDAQQFQSIPKRTYDVKGLIINVPSNYDPESGTYVGVWNGTFKMAWTNNPAWVFYDLLVNSRYGLGQFITAAQIDKWTLYAIGQWCDQLVANGRGGQERRFQCNALINSQQEAFDLLNSLASVFRGGTYWAGGQLVPTADMPRDPDMLYTNANVIDGQFSYSGSDIRARHNMVSVSWNDPDNLGEPRLAVVEDQDGISRYGIQKTDVIAVGCTSESQAIRVGKWTMFSETYEGETVTFAAGYDTAWTAPGHICAIADLNVGGERRGGRVVAATTTEITIDAPVTFLNGQSYQLSCVMADGKVESHPAAGSGETSVVTVASPFSAAPLPDTIWVLASSDLQPSLWRVVSSKQSDPDRYELTALRHHPDKWAYVENNIALSNPDITNVGLMPTISNVVISDYLVALSAVSVGVRMLMSWQSVAPSFEVSYRPVNGVWIRATTPQTSLDVEAIEGQYEIWITPINSMGRRGVTTKFNYTVVGRLAPPHDPVNFRIQVINGVAMFQWAPATDIDVIIGGSFQMRYSPRFQDVTWASANTVLTSIPGTATTVELPWRPGTYLLRTRDIVGLFSQNAAVVITSGPDTAYRPYYRICEQPDWLGNKLNTEIQEPQDWLVLGVTGGLWDDQLDPIDSWPTIDILPVGAGGQAPGEGFYNFFNFIDMGGVFAVRLTVDMLAFPFIESETFVDDRPGLVDDWQDWDESADDGNGMVTVRIRQTDDDPASPSARWGEWSQFLSGEYTGRGFQFQAWMTAPSGQNIAIEQLCILADISNKSDQGADVSWHAPKMHITYAVKFFLIPSISIAIQDGIVGDTYRISNKTREGFDLELISGAGAIITAARTFDWISQGY